jgi:hypothetical protein
MSLDDLATELIARGYRLCFCLELHCSEHGDVRLNVEAEPQAEHACPLCGANCPAVTMGRGITRRELPNFGVVCAPVQAVRARNARGRRLANRALMMAGAGPRAHQRDRPVGVRHPSVVSQFEISAKAKPARCCGLSEVGS